MSLADLKFRDLQIWPSEEFLIGVPGDDYIVRVPSAHREEISSLREELEKCTTSSWLKYGEMYFRVSIMACIGGKSYALRRVPPLNMTFQQIGYPPSLVESLLNLQSGLLLFSGATASGKTTSASSYVVEWTKRYGLNTITLEDPPEYMIHGKHGKGLCTQTEMVQAQNFSEGLSESLRHGGPRLLFIGELREPHAVCEAIRAAHSGHLVVATTHSDSLVKTLVKMTALAKMEMRDQASQFLAEAIQAIVCQELKIFPSKTQIQSKSLLLSNHSLQEAIRTKIREGKFESLIDEVNK